jgi:hypothetical protein
VIDIEDEEIREDEEDEKREGEALAGGPEHLRWKLL